MTRGEFTTGYSERFRNVRQKEQRCAHCLDALKLYGSSWEREQAYAEAVNNLEAVTLELADFVFDALPLVASGVSHAA